MTSLTASPRRAVSVADARITFPHLVHAEWVSLWSLRGNVVSLVLGALFAILAAVGFSVIWGFATQRAEEPLPVEVAPPLMDMALNGVVIVQIVAVLIGVGAFAKEHSTGSLRTQLAAAPRRVGVLGAKATVVGLVTAVWAALVFVVSAIGVAIVYTAFDFPVAFDSPLTQIAIPVLGAAVLVALSAVLGLGVAALLRSETWAVSLVLVFLLILPTVFLSLPFEWALHVAELLMGQTGSALYTVHESVDGTVVRDIALTFAWPAAALVAGMAVVRRRDV
ncbi:hypothetical protein N8K70_16685 [Microbacterium betulae]|uniref:ABC transporter permease n=1 Tax=Microbacterium betulae TaxID=2981139 RepID=A0AA97I5R0_9MICO|nr:hypothetical protein [Microbacterium sp. AB]WOF23009.1 hypothetical protein N8K70_16685 [Microbacterium sp. AB]